MAAASTTATQLRDKAVTALESWIAHKLSISGYFSKVVGQVQRIGDHSDRRSNAQAVLGAWSTTRGPRTNVQLCESYQMIRASLAEVADENNEIAVDQIRFAALTLLCSVHYTGTSMQQLLHYWWDPVLFYQSGTDREIRALIEQLTESEVDDV